MALQPRQIAANTVGDQRKECKVTFDNATLSNSLVLVCVSVAIWDESRLPQTKILATSGSTPVTFAKIREEAENFLAGAFWMREACPALSSITVRCEVAAHNFQVVAVEVPGIALSGALDRVVLRKQRYQNYPDSCRPNSGTTPTTAQAEELVIGAILNRYASTQQSGFGGGLGLLRNTVSSSKEPDKDRTRMTVHAASVAATGQYRLSANLGTGRDWIAFLATFKAGISGPLKLTTAPGSMALRTRGSGQLTVFGPLSTKAGSRALVTSGVRGRISPGNYQYVIGGWGGLTIGAATDYDVRTVTGLEGVEMRSTDTDQAREDGALRGVDLQEPRLVVFELDMAGSEAGVEALLADLLRALRPRRDEDWPLIWRHPGRPVRQLWCRPVTLARGLDWRFTLLQRQRFALRAADPRHYGIAERTLTVPVTTGDAATATATNAGWGDAFPRIEITGPSSGADVTRVELINLENDDRFDVLASLTSRSLLVGDMQAIASGAPRSPVTIDGARKYGAWQEPRETFRIAPGANPLLLRTEPAGAPVTCRLTFTDTWPG